MHFAAKMPVKKTYKAMQCYYEVLNDKSSAVEFKMLHNMAKSRLHAIRAIKAGDKAIECAEIPLQNMSKKEKLSVLAKTFKYSQKALYEKILRTYYSIL
jgi:hypothetical protein